MILEDGHHQQKDTDPHLVQGWDQQVEHEEEWLHQVVSLLKLKIFCFHEKKNIKAYWNFFFNQYLSRGIQFSRASINGALTQHKNKDIKTLKLEN